MILAGDIGGTKTTLALFERAGGESAPLHETRFESGRYGSLESIVREFLDATGARPDAACFGVAGAVANGRAQVTNLPWLIDAEALGQALDISRVRLLNDLEAIATAVPVVRDDALHTLHPGVPVAEANKLVVAPGTGLGAAFLVWTGHEYRACPSEGGHMSFSPRNAQETELLRHMQRRTDHVSFERVCSGSFLPNIYGFLLGQGSYPEPAWLGEALGGADDPTPVIVQAALAERADICVATLDMFVRMLGTFIGNLAVTLLPRGGIYLGGGIPPRILDRLQQPDFHNAITDKGRFSALCTSLPVHVMLDPAIPLRGAARAS